MFISIEVKFVFSVKFNVVVCQNLSRAKKRLRFKIALQISKIYKKINCI